MKTVDVVKPIKVVVIIGSNRRNGNTDILVEEAIKGAESMGAQVSKIYLRNLNFSDCIGCEGCAKTMKCVIKDDMQSLYPLLEEAQGLILASPTCFYNVTGIMKMFLDRLYPYELFDPENRHIWMGAMENGIRRFAMTIALGEQDNEDDLGFTSAAMSKTIEAIGYRCTDNLKFKDLVYVGDAINDKKALRKSKEGGIKLVKSCLLSRKK